MKENESWQALCAMTTEMFPEYGSRPEAFRAACRKRPDLAAKAIDPLGAPVVPGKGSTEGTAESVYTAESSPLVRAAERLAQTGRFS